MKHCKANICHVFTYHAPWVKKISQFKSHVFLSSYHMSSLIISHVKSHHVTCFLLLYLIISHIFSHYIISHIISHHISHNISSYNMLYLIISHVLSHHISCYISSLFRTILVILQDSLRKIYAEKKLDPDRGLCKVISVTLIRHTILYGDRWGYNVMLRDLFVSFIYSINNVI